MSRYEPMFDRLRTRRQSALGVFLMLGDPNPTASSRLLDCLVEGGADMVEVGIPFSDPVADGPVIQAAAGRALEAGVRTGDCLELIAGFRERHPQVPIGILTYANIAIAPGFERFCDNAAAAGADSLLIADVPSLEAEPWCETMRSSRLDPVLIAATNTPPANLARIARLCGGYTYCVARPGVTGARDDLELAHGSLFAEFGRLGAPPPVLGFGISRPEHVRAAIAAGAAGVISGSAIVDLVTRPDAEDAIRGFVASMKAATTVQAEELGPDG